jgi:predicted DCC family thiol-disulfide oxidoreductase YuxK
MAQALAAKPVVLYDGRCRLCTGGADRIRRFDTEHALEVLDLHDPAVAARYPTIRREDVLAEMHFVRPEGTIAKGHQAVREVLRVIPRYRWLALFWTLPGFDFVADRAYKWVAKNRYRWNRSVTCESDVCRMH